MSDFDALLGKGSAGGKRGRSKKAKQTYLRYDPDTGKKGRFTRDDDEYDEWLTPAQYRKQQAEEEKDQEGEKAAESEQGLKGFAKDVGKDILRDLKRKPRRGRRVSPAQRRKAAQESRNITKNLTGKSVITKVKPLALRLGIAAAVIGAVWWSVKTLEARAVRKRVEAAVAATEARLKRPLTDAELAALLPQYEAWFKAQQKRDKIAKLSTLR